MKGKCYSMVDRGQRRAGDLYETPYSMTRQFLSAIQLPREFHVLNPACGEDAMLDILGGYFTDVTGYDIKEGMDFLKEERQFDYIIENPPYSLAFEFIQKAKEVAKFGFAFLLPLSYLHGKKRYDAIWTSRECPLKEIYVFTRYPMLGDPLRPDGKYRTGMQVYAWMVWERGWLESPMIKWIDNNEFVLKKGE